MKRINDFAVTFSDTGQPKSIVIHSGCAEPHILTRMLAEHADMLKGSNIYSLMPMGAAPYAYTDAASTYTINTFFPGIGLRKSLNEGHVSRLRYPLSQIPSLFHSREIRADMVLLQVSEPDANGNVSLGISVDYMKAVLRQKPIIIAEISSHMPATCGDSSINILDIDWFVEAKNPPQTISFSKPILVDETIAENVASLVSDGSVLQIGVGSLPDQVLARLKNFKHLGLHSGIITDAVRPLIESGVIDNSLKRRFRGVSITTMAAGTQSFYDFLDNNREIEFHPCCLTHDAEILTGIDRLVAINSALQIDLNGCANAEIANGKYVSMPGGLPDFAAAAAAAEKGVSIIAIRSTYKNGERSNIIGSMTAEQTTLLPEHITYVVTEYGIAPISGVSTSARAKGLISISHPKFREDLERQHNLIKR
jgi:4-hydroxybutyrate CoA-transferase